MKPLVSVIIPVYNNRHLISRAIESVLKQTYQNFELIIIDDASTENVREEIEKYSDPRIKYIRHFFNKGAAAARNTGILASKGEFIAFQDSDDEWLENKLERQVNLLLSSSPKIGVIHTRMNDFHDGQMNLWPPDSFIKVMNKNFKSLLLKFSFINIHCLVRKTCFDKLGLFNEKLPALEDWDLWLRISEHYSFKFINEPLVNRFMQKKGLTNDSNKRTESLEILLKKYSKEMASHPYLLAARYFEIGYYYLLKGNFKSGWCYYLFSLRYFPLYVILFIPYLIALLYFHIINSHPTKNLPG